ncbi:DUF4258 domain-containing protein [Marinomonas sp. IMCC 4694]|uniref:DUF4258 domain-containing protein n=1 Tax=Marinomonas sp. IMCC 4694 TaxID=2605432 RepID=UPI0011E7BC09|nr:DUF4258 domain-containing protein [Marinomonas sp. IMCC 4694]TYL46513.1 DUF4258 domain-containing protein [Marinomonas sp. IMCC 4694]
MKKNNPQGNVVFPLSEFAARKTLNDLAENHTNRIRWSRHIKERMLDRGVTTRQILTLLKSKRSIFREGPYLELNGDWKCNIKGMAAGSILELSVVIKHPADNPTSILITVWGH